MKNDGQDNWSWTAWQGFFMSVVKALGDGEWNYVPNPSGGFLGLWWHWREIEGGYAYLQLEQTKACFKVEVGDGSADDLKWTWNTRIIATAAESQLNVTKPTRLRRGTWMTVAVLDCDYRAAREDGTIDFEKTVDTLRAMEEIGDKAVESNIQV